MLPILTSEQVREADEIAAQRYGIPVDWLMEAAGWCVARHCRGGVAVVCGKGNNGGDGLAVARHLHGWGRLVSVCADLDSFHGPAAFQARVLRRLGVTVDPEPRRLRDADMIVDAIFGTGLNRSPEGVYAEWIEAINASGRPVVAVDLPSGLDSDTGEAHTPTIRAMVTVTLGLPKAGLVRGDGPAVSGEVWVADIGIPPQVFHEMGIEFPDHLLAGTGDVRLSELES